jgi:osmoprotectant transport system ATP-binding protein
VIDFQGVSKYFGNVTAVNKLTVTFMNGLISVIIGPSGCGKTTILKMVNRLIDPDEGMISINDIPVEKYNPVELRRYIGYVIQEIGLFPHYTVYNNIAIVPHMLRWDNARIHRRVMELMELINLDESYCSKYPAQLSGGERQRVGLARALAADPDILIMDEPFGSIDPINRLTLQDTLLEIQEIIRKTIVFVTHDINEAIKIGDRIAVMDRGTLVQYGTPQDILSNPINEFVELLLGHDRNVKALSLKKVMEFIERDGFITVTHDISHDRLNKILTNSSAGVAFVVNEDQRLSGRYYREKKPDSTYVIVKDSEPVYIEKSANLNETLSKMLETGERILPVLNAQGEFLGVVTLSNLFDEVSRESSD